MTYFVLLVSWVFLERTWIPSGIQFTTYFIEIFVVESSSFVSVTLTRQTCERSSRTAESKRRATGNYFSERICSMFLISKCRGDRDLGLRTTLGLAFGERSAMTNSDFSCVETRFFPGSRHCVAVLQTQAPKVCTDLDLSLLYILISGTYSKFAKLVCVSDVMELLAVWWHNKQTKITAHGE